MFEGFPLSIGFALLSGSIIPVFLVLSGYLTSMSDNSSQRFKYSVGAGWFAYGLLIAGSFATGLIPSLLDVLTGLAIMMSASVLAFILWSLIVWGFTLNLLLAANHTEAELDAKQWLDAYSQGNGIQKLTNDRVRILLDLNFVIRGENDAFAVTKSGLCAAFVFTCLRNIFGISNRD